jgi:hypothetical protein
MVLIGLRLETSVNLQKQFQNGNLDLYWTLTLGFTAFASRRAFNDSICLASRSGKMLSFGDCPGKKLSIDDCPAIGLHLFELIHGLKADLIFAGLSKEMTTGESAAVIEEWPPGVLRELKESEPVHKLADPRLSHALETLCIFCLMVLIEVDPISKS